MNIYEKLQMCRVKLQNAGLKKTGLNKFSGYDYFELGDFLPKTNELFAEHKLLGHVLFTSEKAILRIVDAEKPEDCIIFECPNAELSLKGCHPIQNIGATQTYQRRYLYVAAMEVVEHDVLDATTDTNNPIPTTQKQKATKESTKPVDTPQQDNSEIISQAQLTRLHTLVGVHKPIAKVVIKAYGYESSKDIKKVDYQNICDDIENEIQANLRENNEIKAQV